MPRRKPRNKGGRPTKFTVHRAVAVACALNSGFSLEYAARRGGIGSATLYRWLLLGPFRSLVLRIAFPEGRKRSRNTVARNQKGQVSTKSRLNPGATYPFRSP